MTDIAHQTVLVTWIQDWSCNVCYKYGGVRIHATGHQRAEDGLPVAQESNEEILEMIFRAHRGEGLCRNPLFRLSLGRQWRWERMTDGQKRMIVMKRPGDPPGGIKVYKWPPWVEG